MFFFVNCDAQNCLKVLNKELMTLNAVAKVILWGC